MIVCSLILVAISVVAADKIPVDCQHSLTKSQCVLTMNHINSTIFVEIDPCDSPVTVKFSFRDMNDSWSRVFEHTDEKVLFGHPDIAEWLHVNVVRHETKHRVKAYFVENDSEELFYDHDFLNDSDHCASSPASAEIVAFIVFFGVCFILSGSLCIAAHFHRRKLMREGGNGVEGTLLAGKECSGNSSITSNIIATNGNGKSTNGVKKSSTLIDLAKLPVIHEESETAT